MSDATNQPTWDVFISHASEDKETVARPLAEALARHGVEVWFDAEQLTLGDSLRRSIDEGLAKSRYGLVILSKHFFLLAARDGVVCVSACKWISVKRKGKSPTSTETPQTTNLTTWPGSASIITTSMTAEPARAKG